MTKEMKRVAERLPNGSDIGQSWNYVEVAILFFSPGGQ
jgi:hypothetical protein